MTLNFRRQRSFDHLLAYADEVTDASTFEKKAGNKKQDTKSKRSTPDPWLKKPLWAVSDFTGDEELTSDSTRSLHRHLSLFDLISIGVSATIGSGVFVLCGLIAKEYAGPATFISWLIAGISACFSGLCYAELSGKFAVAGSSYNYVVSQSHSFFILHNSFFVLLILISCHFFVIISCSKNFYSPVFHLQFVTMGELPAVIAGACLTLEYVFSASAVARSWGDKVVAYVLHITSDSEISPWMQFLLDPGYNINPSAFVVSAVSVILLLTGVKESQQVTNFFTIFKVCLVLFMCFTALAFVQPENFRPLFPIQFGGIVGIMRGSTSSFFGMIGYDEVCCMVSHYTYYM